MVDDLTESHRSKQSVVLVIVAELGLLTIRLEAKRGTFRLPRTAVAMHVLDIVLVPVLRWTVAVSKMAVIASDLGRGALSSRHDE